MKTINNFLIIVLAAVLLAAMTLAGCKDNESIANTGGIAREAAAVAVSVVVVEPEVMQDVVFLPGETEAYEDVQVASNISRPGRMDRIQRGSNREKGSAVGQN